MNIKKLYRYLLFSGLMAQAFTPIGSLAFKLQNGQMMSFGFSLSTTMDVHTSLVQSEAQYFPDGNGSMLCLSNGAPVEPKVGSFGIFLKNNVHYIFKIMGSGTALALGANEYHWIRNSVVSKFMNDSAGVMYPYAVMQGIFSCIDSNLSDKLDQNRIYNYLGGRNDYVLRSFYAIIENLFEWLNGLKNKDKQTIDFSTLRYEIYLCFINWLCKMASESVNINGTYIYNTLYKAANEATNSQDYNKIGIFTATVEFWSNPANAGICEFWNATMAWFLCVFGERGVRNANGESLIKFAIAELQWLKECVDLFLRNGQLNDEVMINVTTQGCMRQLKNYCYLLFHYKKKMYDVLKSSSIDMNNDDSLRQIKASLDNLCKQWNGRELQNIVSPKVAVNVKSVDKFQLLLNFLRDKDRNNALNAETDLNNLRNFLYIKYENIDHSKIDSVEEEKLNLVARYIDSMQRVLCHIRTYSLWIKDNLKTYGGNFNQPANRGPGYNQNGPSKSVFGQPNPQGHRYNQNGPGKSVFGQHNPYNSKGNNRLSSKSVFGQPNSHWKNNNPQGQKNKHPQGQKNNNPQGSARNPNENNWLNDQKNQIEDVTQRKTKEVQDNDNAPSSLEKSKPDANLPATGVDKNVNNSPQSKMSNGVASKTPLMPLNNVVSPVQNDTYNSLASMTLPGSSAGSSLHNTYTPSKGKTFMSKTLPRKGKMRSNLNETAGSKKSSKRRRHSKSRKNLKGGKKHKHRKLLIKN